jgi:glycosyltransferase involved in cell wall biosynthesis
MKLIIQIPCFNETGTLAVTLADLPRSVEGFGVVEWLVIDDGSTDGTADLARELGVDHVVTHAVNRGLATAFMTGLHECLAQGADVIVNTDADNQYRGSDIPALTAPIVNGRADMVIGARPIDDTQHFSWLKKKLQRLGSWAVRKASRTEVLDAPSGFRAISRESAFRLNVFSAYTYTLETIIQAGLSNLRVVSVPIHTNADLRPSRLVKSISSYVRRSLMTIFRVFLIYRPLAMFFGVAMVFLLVGSATGARFLYYYLNGSGGGHVQSVVFTGLCLTIGSLLLMMGFIADIIAVNRKLLERIELRLKYLQHPGAQAAAAANRNQSVKPTVDST